MSAFLILGELVAQGSWWRLFNEPNLIEVRRAGRRRCRLSEDRTLPRVQRRRRRPPPLDLRRDRIAPRAGDSLRVESLPGTSDVVVRRDNSPYDRWHATGAGTIEIDTDIEQHDFDVLTGSATRRHGSRDQDGPCGAPGHPPPSRLPEVTANAVRDADS